MAFKQTNWWEGNQFRMSPRPEYVPPSILDVQEDSILPVPKQVSRFIAQEGDGPSGVSGPASASSPVGAGLSTAANTAAERVFGKTTGPIGYSPAFTDKGILGTISDVANMATQDTAQFGFGGKYGPIGFNPAATAPAIGFNTMGYGPQIGPDLGLGPEIEWSGPSPTTDWSNPYGGTEGSQGGGMSGGVGDDATGVGDPGADDFGEGGSDGGGSSCYISNALNDTGFWTDSEKRQAVKWCRDTHHQNGVDTWVRGYHVWGLAVSKIARKSKTFRSVTRYLSNKFVGQATGKDKTALGWCVKYLFADPLSYAIGVFKEDK